MNNQNQQNNQNRNQNKQNNQNNQNNQNKNQNQQRESAGLEIEEKADEKEECITHESLVSNHRKYHIHYCKERPEVELSEQ